MKIYRHWVCVERELDDNGRKRSFSVYGGSNISPADARQQGQQQLDRIQSRLAEGGGFGPYGYADRAVREPILDELQSGDRTAAIITRNAYGAHVLNTPSIMFADIDLPGDQSPVPTIPEWVDWFSFIPGIRRRIAEVRKMLADRQANRHSTALERIREIVARHSDLGMRVYRTAAGLRCLVTNQTWDPCGEPTQQLLTGLNSDPLYVRLCHTQRCFRARLTGKPWRMGLGNPPQRICGGQAQSSELAGWLGQYEQRHPGYSVCRYLETIGRQEVSPLVEPVLAVHDTLCVGELPLA